MSLRWNISLRKFYTLLLSTTTIFLCVQLQPIAKNLLYKVKVGEGYAETAVQFEKYSENPNNFSHFVKPVLIFQPVKTKNTVIKHCGMIPK